MLGVLDGGSLGDELGRLLGDSDGFKEGKELG